ncbi:MAG: twin-arginine translocase subunit TatB [Chloroflexi bacterium]|nr:MAG: twin-arginine translocase subunit TatB [Chloroflexota bacterium]
MFGIGAGELLLILVVALIVLGPERMPKVARDIGKVVNELRRTSDELRDEFLNSDRAISKPQDVTGSQAPATSPATPALAAGTAPVPEGESPFDREMREARERLKAQRDT